APARARDALAQYLREAHETGGGGAERRTAPRYERAGFITILRGAARADAAARPTLARFRDASTGGIGIYLDVPMAIGEEFVVRVPHARGQKMPVVYRVVRCYRADATAGAQYAIGAQVARVVREAETR
ncbi:MAG: PilZ domain-containing protein, partial [Phycisphaerae bacterium]